MNDDFSRKHLIDIIAVNFDDVFLKRPYRQFTPQFHWAEFCICILTLLGIFITLVIKYFTARWSVYNIFDSISCL